MRQFSNNAQIIPAQFLVQVIGVAVFGGEVGECEVVSVIGDGVSVVVDVGGFRYVDGLAGEDVPDGAVYVNEGAVVVDDGGAVGENFIHGLRRRVVS